MRTTSLLAVVGLAVLAGSAGTAIAETEAPSLEAINEAEFKDAPQIDSSRIEPLVLKAQVLLDRAHVSPGVIDGYYGENFQKSVRAFETMHDLEADGMLDADTWSLLVFTGDKPVFRRYAITREDAEGPFVDEIPEDYAKQAEMEALSYTSIQEMLAERFHMDEDLLLALNPGAEFRADEEIVVAAVRDQSASTKVDKVEVSRSNGSLSAYAEDGTLVLFAPATVGSEDLPSPTGTHKVMAVVTDPNYTYRPDVNFKQGDLDETLILPPGPNNPVGSVWIDLSEPTYGVHGTPEPSKIDKTASHGCVRLTNWDARELAGLIGEGDTVAFVD